jgi:hypothetical protein
MVQTVLDENSLLASVAQLGAKGAEKFVKLHHCITEQTLNLVIPAKAGIQFKLLELKMDSHLHGNDGSKCWV